MYFNAEGVVGGDYSAPTGRYRLDTGETSDCLDVTIFNDVILEDVEEFIGQLVGFEVDGTVQSVIPGVILQPQRTSVEISDNDGNITTFQILSQTYNALLIHIQLSPSVLRGQGTLSLSLAVVPQRLKCVWCLPLVLLVRE